MKLLVTGDWHYRANPPRARLDNFQETLNEKLQEVGDIARKYDADAIVVPGDVLDSPSPAYSTLTALEQVIKDLGRQIWAIPGNHDEFGHSLESLNRTAYGHLAGTGMIADLTREPVIAGCVVAEGNGFSANTDNGIDDYIKKCNTPSGMVSIVVAHGMLLERAPGFEIKHTLVDAVARYPRCPDVLICGHEHLGFGVKRLPRAKGGELVAINPGALVRLSAHPGEIERMPQVCLLEVYPGTAPMCPQCDSVLVPDKNDTARCPRCHTTCFHVAERFSGEYGPPEIWHMGEPVIETTLIPLACARPGHEVLSRAHIEQAADREAKMGEFLELLANEGESRFLDLQAMVEGIAGAEGLGKDVVDEALGRIAEAREALGARS